MGLVNLWSGQLVRFDCICSKTSLTNHLQRSTILLYQSLYLGPKQIIQIF